MLPMGVRKSLILLGAFHNKSYAQGVAQGQQMRGGSLVMIPASAQKRPPGGKIERAGPLPTPPLYPPSKKAGV